MKILIAVAHPNELKIIKQAIKKLSLIWIDIKYLQTWVGNYETIFNLSQILEKEQFDFLLNIWICWYKLNNDWLFQVARVFNFSTKKELVVPIGFAFTRLNSIWCSDVEIRNIYEIWDENYVDMESYWIEFIANKYRIPRIMLKLPADKIGEKLDYKLLTNACEKLWNIDYNNLFTKIKEYLSSNTQNRNFDYIKDKYRFSYAEFEIFKNKINKYEALAKQDFWDFFNKNCNLDKNDFLNLFNESISDL